MAAKKLKRRSPEEKAAILAEIGGDETMVSVAKRHKLPIQTLYAWNTRANKAKRGKPRAGKATKPSKARRANGHANGNAVAGLDHVHDQLTAALTSVEAMREAFRNVFGGGA